jgi:hypothetical protein
MSRTTPILFLYPVDAAPFNLMISSHSALSGKHESSLTRYPSQKSDARSERQKESPVSATSPVPSSFSFININDVNSRRRVREHLARKYRPQKKLRAVKTEKKLLQWQKRPFQARGDDSEENTTISSGSSPNKKLNGRIPSENEQEDGTRTNSSFWASQLNVF